MRKPPGLDFLAQVAVGRRNEPEIHLARLVFADAIDLALFQHTQEMRLQIERHLADLIEKQGAAAGRFDLADGMPP
jgi:hypothetical protein